jgi:archaellum component FlaG (FlaF/FlaG flagellin family)
MKGQFSVEFIIDVSIILVLVAFLVFFFSNFANANTIAATMSSVCSQVAQSINAVASSGGLSMVQSLPLLNTTGNEPYNISVSDGVIIIHLIQTSSKPLALIANTNTVSCGSNTRATANESFLMSNLAVFQNGTTINLAYLSGNYTIIVGSSRSSSTYPITIDGGGFVGNSSFSLLYPNGTSSIISYYQAQFVYNSTLLIASLSSGNYNFYLKELSNPLVSVSLPLVKS